MIAIDPPPTIRPAAAAATNTFNDPIAPGLPSDPSYRGTRKQALAESFLICSISRMDSIDPTQITDALLTSAGWARVGLTAPTEHIREQAAKELALTICQRINPTPIIDHNQLRLPL
ncbi:DUF6771 family protein [Sphingomonas sp.]|uniref:DUF6771 family protein n=1 Tax=Sphingomonas sp. TaxID=28214 RepID=UPI0035B42CC2